MKRKIIKDLEKWKDEGAKLPYMLVGARQVGKTYILDNFCKNNFKEYLYINLEKERGIKDVFEKTIDPEEIIYQLGLMKGKKINFEQTVIFLDEIQVSESAITSLKYFCESEKPYNIVTAGSLLGVALNRFEKSFPVGKVRKNYLYPMDFEEFLWASGDDMLASEIRKCFISDKMIFDTVHEKLLKLYKDYLFVGGMPASVIEYVKNSRSLLDYDRIIKQNIIEDYISDMSKYTTTSENMKIKKIYNSIPKQLGRDSNKFSYKLVEEGARKLYYETSIEWLINSNLVNKCTLVEEPRIPLKAYENEGHFKVYLNDVGLLSELSNMSAYDIYNEDGNIFKGMLTENYVAQALASKDYNLNYWRSSNTSEIDFLMSIKGEIIPIEVKSATNTKSKSLNVYIDKYSPKYSIRISAKNFGFVNNIKSVPLYAAHLIKEIM
ncbi:MAG TPA: ATPase [Clostridiales bacterium]|nr:MAG: hypothetical protein A2Y18_04655 [Clostridiales bacterium GWD2_32_19]HCC07121.1 ATPase [Clostridiales bacterium]